MPWVRIDDHFDEHPKFAKAGPLGVATGDLVRVETEIGHYVVRAWVTEGIRPGVVACSHHMGRWKPSGPFPGAGGGPAGPGGGDGAPVTGQRQMMATVDLDRGPGGWSMRRRDGARPYASTDPDTLRIWWTDVGRGLLHLRQGGGDRVVEPAGLVRFSGSHGNPSLGGG